MNAQKIQILLTVYRGLTQAEIKEIIFIVNILLTIIDCCDILYAINYCIQGYEK